MSGRPHRVVSALVRTLLAFGAGALLLSLLGAAAGLRINRSGSLPPGLYRRTDAPVRPGAIVLACPPPAAAQLARARGYLHAGACPGDVEPLGKIVVATAGADVEVRREGIVIDGRAVPGSAPRATDGSGRPMPSLAGRSFVLAPDEVWLFAPHPQSFDSRIFGPVRIASLRGSVVPLWTSRTSREPPR